MFSWCFCCREHAPSIIFMDEVDSIGSARTENSGGGGDSEVQRTMLELLNQLDGFEASNKIKVCGCSILVAMPGGSSTSYVLSQAGPVHCQCSILTHGVCSTVLPSVNK